MTKRDSFASLSSDVSTPMADILEEIPETVPGKEPGIDEQSVETSQARTSSPVTESSEKPSEKTEFSDVFLFLKSKEFKNSNIAKLLFGNNSRFQKVMFLHVNEESFQIKWIDQ